MDPSLSIPSDPHHPPQFTSYPPFSSSNPFISGAGNPPNHSLFGGPGPVNPFNNHVFQPQPQTQTQPQASSLPPYNSFNHPPYSEMICKAIAALNEPDGSSKMAISRYIERVYTGLPPAQSALLTHHLKTLKNSGVLAMVKKSYKLAASTTPESVAVAAAAAAAGLEVPRSENFPDPAAFSGSASQPSKRGRGRPPKPKPEAQQPSDIHPNGQPIQEQFESAAVTKPTEEGQESAKRRPGRPRKNGAAPIVQGSVLAGIMKRRGRPPGRRAAGRQRKPKSVSSTASVFPYVANGARRRGRPRRVESGAIVPTGGEIVAVAPGMKRGRGRPPKIGVISRLMKPKRGRGRPVGRPRKVMSTNGATATQDSAYGELKRKFDIFQEKAKEIVDLLKAAGVTSENEAVVQQAIHDLEGLIAIETVEPPQVMEEVQPEEAAPQLHTEDENEGEAQGQETEVDMEHTQTEAEAMQEALF